MYYPGASNGWKNLEAREGSNYYKMKQGAVHRGLYDISFGLWQKDTPEL